MISFDVLLKINELIKNLLMTVKAYNNKQKDQNPRYEGF